MSRLQVYAGLSMVSMVAMMYHAFRSRGQFYPAMVYLSTSKISLVLLLNMGLVIMCILWQLTKQVFLGSLREAEVERLNDKSWREVMEILFAITIFRQDFSVSFLAMVTSLLLIKGLHWLAQKRVEYIETTPTMTKLSHIRIVSLLGFLLLVDSLFLYSSLKSLIETRQASVSLLFSFEYTILATSTVSTFVKYIFCVSDMLMEGQWEKKAVYTFYLELIHDLLNLSMYLCFSIMVFINYGVPLHLIRQFCETFRHFKVRVADYIRYRKITSNMKDRFPDATPEELSGRDATCIICRDDMTTAKKLNCGHLFHVNCLRSWLERQNTCPTCRALVMPHESGTTNAVRLGSQSHDDQQAPASTSVEGSTGDCDVVDDDSIRNQTRQQASGSIYGKSIVYPSSATLIWRPGYAVLPQVYGSLPDSTGGHPSSPLFIQYPIVPLQLPGTNNLFSESSNFGMTDDQLETLKRFLEHQIEVLQNQLRQLQKSSTDETTNTMESPLSNKKGKAVACS